MRGHRFREGVKVVTSLQRRNNTAIAQFVRDRAQLPGRFGKIFLGKIQICQWIFPMGIEPRRYDDEIGPMPTNCR